MPDNKHRLTMDTEQLITQLIDASLKQHISDLHLSGQQPVRWRRGGQLELAPDTSLTAPAVLAHLLNEEQQACLRQHGQLDFAVSLATGIRLRGNAFLQRQGVSLALRLLPHTCPTLAALDAPAPVPALLNQQQGLILISGATGSGKSTTLAAMVDHINQHSQRHILTLEDPVEFIYTPASSLIQQREIGCDCENFASGLRAALRQDPDVILIGELRDSETIRLALTAAETGHLVLATLHTRGAPQAIERLADSFPAAEKPLIRSQLASSLQAVLAQKLLPALTGGRIALYELLINTPAVGTLIREGKDHQLPSLLETGQPYGMQSFQQSEQQRIRQGKIAAATPGTALQTDFRPFS